MAVPTNLPTLEQQAYRKAYHDYLHRAITELHKIGKPEFSTRAAGIADSMARAQINLREAKFPGSVARRQADREWGLIRKRVEAEGVTYEQAEADLADEIAELREKGLPKPEPLSHDDDEAA